MASRVRLFAAAAWLAGIAALFVGNVTAEEKKAADVPDLHDIMEKNKGKNAMTAKIAAAAKAEKWEDAQKLAKEFKELGEALGKNTPHKGNKDSWAKHAKVYAEQTAAVSAAADKKDLKAVESTAKTFNDSCKGCHNAHK